MLKCEFIGEAMQIKKILFFLLLMPVILFSQDISDSKKEVSVKALREMSDKEVNDYWIQAQERGYSLDQIKILARAQGISEAEITEFEQRISKITNNTNNESEITEFDSSALTSIFGKNTVGEESEMSNAKILAK